MSAVDQILADRFRADFTDLEYRHRPEVIDQIIADELAGLEQRRARQETDR